MQLLLNWEKIVNRDVYITSSGELDKAMSEIKSLREKAFLTPKDVGVLFGVS